MNYQESLAWIHSRLKQGEKPGLKRVKWLLEQFDNPERHLAAVHVVGTNGKGSTVSYLQHIFTASGYKVGTFTSPYIVEFRERIAIDGQMMTEQELIDLVSQVKPVVERLDQAKLYAPATEFEIITVMMFLYFTRVQPVAIAIIEAGVGGMMDATNVFQALAVVCPSIGLDHQDLLGESYVAIAKQKAGVLKNGEPLILAADRPDVLFAFRASCQASHSPLYLLGSEFTIDLHEQGFDFHYQEVTLDNLHLAMLGQHQKRNASLAIMTALLLQKDFPQVSLTHIRQGLASSQWVGRTEFMGPNLMLDGAHNMESIAALVALLEQQFAGKKIHMLVAAIKNKPIEPMLTALSHLGQVTVTSFDFPKSLPLSAYPQSYHQVAQFQTWLAEIDPSSEQDFYVITGSLYFISQVRAYLTK
ncbi:bifunctional folylpolyglutamate synthase/dihydrofolate synthase [Streptococcus halichoeri]|uniref:bifunctional folylpolyglutamate synthase/dihydrofolate synthase n=1 Tax=Streptococcus halichoeri TaxID=254785 RepID=UPI00135ACBFD|nr:folylpolyglutamate synthase/dihydrofolate synthase family protein [Streptococcus halichoeri]